MPHGIFRERQDDKTLVCMKYDHHNLLVPEDFYRECGFPPPFAELPWKKEYERDRPASSH
jgi:hypothetical protein